MACSRILDFWSDATDVMAALYVFLLNSHHEGLAVALIGAMTLDLPVVSIAVGGIPEMVTCDHEHHFVTSRSEREMTQTLTGPSDDAALRSRYGPQSRGYDARAVQRSCCDLRDRIHLP
jgi:glycosyltransferase involved in cell wall biosynthesis